MQFSLFQQGSIFAISLFSNLEVPGLNEPSLFLIKSLTVKLSPFKLDSYRRTLSVIKLGFIFSSAFKEVMFISTSSKASSDLLIASKFAFTISSPFLANFFLICSFIFPIIKS